MKRKRSSHRKTHKSPDQSLWTRLPLRQIGIVVGVLILIGAVLILKNRQSPASSAEPVAAGPTLPAEYETPSDPGDSVPLDTVTAEATLEKAPSPTANVLPEQQLDRLLQAGDPVFLFFHSNTCAQCVKMTGIVEEVYPDFSDSVELVDVNVYDERNRSLLQRANIRAIPTLIFVDAEGEVSGHVGVMEPDALREKLTQLAEE
jgi:thiol-disulfide isomerase/thioredoxin